MISIPIIGTFQNFFFFYHICIKIACNQRKYCVMIINTFYEDFMLRWILVPINVVFVCLECSLMFFRITFITHTHTHTTMLNLTVFWVCSDFQVSVNFPLNIRHYSLGAPPCYTLKQQMNMNTYTLQPAPDHLYLTGPVWTPASSTTRIISFSKHQYVRSWSVALVKENKQKKKSSNPNPSNSRALLTRNFWVSALELDGFVIGSCLVYFFGWLCNCVRGR